MILYVQISLFDPLVEFFLSFSYFFFLFEIFLFLVKKIFGELVLFVGSVLNSYVCQCFDSV